MVALDTTSGYEQDLLDLETIEVPYDRLENSSPVIHKPAAVLSGTNGTQLTGTIINLHAGESIAVVDIKTNKIYLHQVRNVLTYSGGAEATWGLLNFGLPVYYDRSSTMPSGVHLSLSPLDENGNANPLFGHIVWKQTEVPEPFQGDRDPYPLGSTTAGTTHLNIAIVQV